ncbi:MAG: AMP-binding protein, partial [Pseudorhodobacter sp.]|nr:AMP-binding protein [Rhizobacter sp.]
MKVLNIDKVNLNITPQDNAGAPVRDSRAPNAGMSHVVGTDIPALCERTISELLDDNALRWPEAMACVFCDAGVRWTWAELRDESDRLAGGLLSLGFQTGDRLGIWSPNRSEWILAQYATARIGVVLVNINPAYRLAELEYALNKVACKGLVSAPAFKTSLYLEMLQTLAPELSGCAPGSLRAARLPHLRCVIRMGRELTPGMFNLHEVMGNADAENGVERVAQARRIGKMLHSTDAINVQFTSGTTGNPKGATLTHRNMVNNAFAVAAAMGFTKDDRLCIPVPLYHCFGMVMGSLVCTVTGGTMVFPGEGFDALATLNALQDEACTALHGVPTMFIAELDHPEFKRFNLNALRKGVMAGSPCPVEVMKRVIKDMNMSDVTIAYGMTETSPVSFQSAPTDPLELRVATVGRVMPHLEVKIVDSA